MQTDLGLIPDRSHVDPTSTKKRFKIGPKSDKTIDSIAYSMGYSMDSMESMDSMDSHGLHGDGCWAHGPGETIGGPGPTLPGGWVGPAAGRRLFLCNPMQSYVSYIS